MGGEGTGIQPDGLGNEAQSEPMTAGEQKRQQAGWEWLTNVAGEPDDFQYIRELEERFGRENVKISEAYDVSGDLLPNSQSVYLKEGAKEKE